MENTKAITDKILKSAKVPWRSLEVLQPKGFKELSPGAMKKLRASIIKNDFVESFKVWENDGKLYCLDGVHRCIVLDQLADDGYDIPDKFRADFIDVKDKKQAKKLILIYSSRYAKLLGDGLFDFVQDLDWPDVELVVDLPDIDIDMFNEKISPTIGLTDEDAIPEATEAITKTGDLWLLGEHRVLCGDATKKDDVERLMDGEKADMVFTSPPYAVGVEYGKYDDTIENLRGMLPKLSSVWMNNIRRGGYAVVNFGDIVSAKNIVKTQEPCEYPMALEYWPVFRADNWMLWSRRIWCKPCAGTVSMQCISSNRAATNWEHLWTWKAPGKSLHDKQTVGEYPSQNGWIDSTHSHKLGIGLSEHGAGMPVFVALYGVSTHSMDGGIVHEPFCGTGTTLIACEKTKRKCYGMEIDEHYCDVIVKRWEDYTGEKGKLSNV